MPFEIKYVCQSCGERMRWVYDGDLEPHGVRGCLGNNCSRLHELSVEKVNEQEANAIRTKYEQD